MKRVVTFLEKFPLFYLLIPLFLVIHIEKEFRGLIIYAFVYRDMIELFIAPLPILLLSYLLFRNWSKALFFTLPTLLIFYFFADLKDWLVVHFPGSLASTYKFLLPFILVLYIGIYVLVRKKQFNYRRAFLYANLLFILFILADLIALALPAKTSAMNSALAEENRAACKDCIKPDIYYIVFDSYASSEILQSEFGFHNTEIDSFLSEKKFYRVKNARSNYNFTAYSIGSTLNYDFLNRIDPLKKVSLRDYLPYLKVIQENKLVRRLENEGYDIINHSIFDFNDYPSTVPHFDHWALNTLYTRHNIFLKIDQEIGWMWRIRFAKKGIVYLPEEKIIARDRHDSLSMQALKSTLNTPNTKPRFVYTHIEIPHSPFSFDSNGVRFKVPVELSPEKDKANYIGHLVYSNRFVKELVSEVFEKAKRPFVIVLQGDHGFRFFDNTKREMEFDNLSAFYFYNQDYRLLYDGMSNINTFNIVLNTFFHADLPLKKDSSTFIPY